MNKTKIDKKQLESIKYLKKYKKRIIFENIKVWFLNYALKNIFIFCFGICLCFVFYKIIKWEALFYDYHNKAGLIFGDLDNYDKNTHSQIGYESYRNISLEDIILPPVINNTSEEPYVLINQDHDFVKKIYYFLNKNNTKIKQIEIININHDIFLYLDNDIYLKINLKQNIDDLITNLLFIYKDDKTNKIITNKNKDIEYIDFRFGDRIFYKNKNIFNEETLNSNDDLKIKDIDVIIPNH